MRERSVRFRREAPLWPLAPERTGTGLLSRTESVRSRPAARMGSKRSWRRTGLLIRRAGFDSLGAHHLDGVSSSGRTAVSEAANRSSNLRAPTKARGHGSMADSDALEVLSAARRLARSEARGQFPASAHIVRVAEWHEAPGFQPGHAGSIPATCSAGRVDLVSQPGLISQATPVQHGPCYRDSPGR